MKRIHWHCIIILIIMSSCTDMELSTQNNFQLSKYLGTWFEVYRFPHRFEKNLERVSAVYTLKKDNKIEVLNTGYSMADGSRSFIRGSAWVPDSSKPAQLKVRFFWPFAGPYFVIYVDDAYQIALVGTPSRKYLWLLSRTGTLTEEQFKNLRDIAADKGFDISKLEKVKQ